MDRQALLAALDRLNLHLLVLVVEGDQTLRTQEVHLARRRKALLDQDDTGPQSSPNGPRSGFSSVRFPPKI
jgi:hypothetical protein